MEGIITIYHIRDEMCADGEMQMMPQCLFEQFTGLRFASWDTVADHDVL